jgi:hypothetical protein
MKEPDLRPSLYTTQAWHEESRRDFWVAGDGRVALCFTVAGLTCEQAAEVRLEWYERKARDPEASLDPGTLIDIMRDLGHGMRRVS